MDCSKQPDLEAMVSLDGTICSVQEAHDLRYPRLNVHNWLIAFVATLKALAMGMSILAPSAITVVMPFKVSTQSGRVVSPLRNRVADLRLRRQQAETNSQEQTNLVFLSPAIEEEGRLANSWVMNPLAQFAQSFQQVIKQASMHFGFGTAPSLRASGFLL